jgi:hypothetical protein
LGALDKNSSTVQSVAVIASIQDGQFRMILASLIGLLPALLAGSEPPAAPAPAVRTMTVEHQIIWRIPVRPRPRPRIHWDEEKGPKCLPAAAIRGAMLSGPDSIDFLLKGRQVMRARLDSDCPALDFYEGFYVQPEDNKICARRDSIHSRVGASCRIERFRTLVPKVER